jgi:large subunit ribosomal protein L21e
MPFKYYHGKTGVVYNVTKSALGIIIFKKVKHRYIEKRVNVRIEHVQPSRSREGFLQRVKQNDELKKKAKETGEKVNLKRQPLMPRDGRKVDIKKNKPITVAPLAYETTI